MDKTVDAFRTISEVAEALDLPQHVLRFWETRFPQIKPLKRAGGRRFYRPDDVELLRTIRQLLYADGYTIKGVQRILKEHGVRAVVAMQGQRGLMLPPVPGPAAETPALERREPRFDDMPENVAEDAPEVSPEEVSMQASEPRRDPAPVEDLTRSETARHDAHPPRHATDDWRTDAGADSSPPGHAGPPLDASLAQHLKAALFELAECARILEAARRAV